MKNPILEVMDELSGANRVKVCRTFDRNDFEDKYAECVPAAYKPDCKRVARGKSLQLKQEVVDHLIDCLNIEVNDQPSRSGDFYYRRRYSLRELTHEWIPAHPKVIYAQAEVVLSYKGLKKDSPKREQKYNEAAEYVELNWQMHKEEFIAEKIAPMHDDLMFVVEYSNEKFYNNMSRYVVDLDVDAIWLQDSRTEQATKVLNRVEDLKKQIKILKEERNLLDLQLAEFDRDQVVLHFREEANFSDSAKQMLTKFREECRGKLPTTRSRRFS